MAPSSDLVKLYIESKSSITPESIDYVDQKIVKDSKDNPSYIYDLYKVSINKRVSWYVIMTTTQSRTAFELTDDKIQDLFPEILQNKY